MMNEADKILDYLREQAERQKLARRADADYRSARESMIRAGGSVGAALRQPR